MGAGNNWRISLFASTNAPGAPTDDLQIACAFLIPTEAYMIGGSLSFGAGMADMIVQEMDGDKRLASIPLQVELPPMIFEVELVEDLVDDEGTKLDGWFKSTEEAIHLRKGLKPASRWCTLLHEIVHGILAHAGQLELQQNEGLMEALAYGLMNVRVDGKPLVRCWEEHNQES